MKETVTAEAAAALQQTRGAGFSGYLKTVSHGLNYRGIALGVALIVLTCAIWIYWNWGTWGDLSTDCGREVYVSAVIKDGGTLYRDVWYPFGPIAPYVTAVLFRWFVVSIFVPCAAGAIGAL